MIRWEGGEEPVRLMLKEGMRHKWRLVLGFVVICSLGVALGLAWPKTYASSMTIALDQQSIIDALLEGRAVRTEVSGFAPSGTEVTFSQSLLLTALKASGRIDEQTGPKERRRLLGRLRGRIKIKQPAQGLLRIQYSGPNPEAAQAMTARLGQLFIEQILENQQSESEAAFQFIDQQVEEYEQRLAKTRQKIEQLWAEHPIAEPGIFKRLKQKHARLSQRVTKLEQQLETARIREQSLTEQLASLDEPGGGAPIAGAQPYRARLAKLRAKLAKLRLRYYDTYPDIQRLKRRIAQLEQRAEQGGVAALPGASGTGGQSAKAASMVLAASTIYGNLRQQLLNTRTEIETLEAALQEARSKLAAVREKQRKLQDVEQRLAELQRRYRIDHGVYQDLLRRRENARVSRSLDAAGKGFTVRVESPASLPTVPEIPRPLHFAIAGGVLGASLPIALLFLVVMFDPRIRDVSHVPVESGSVLLTTIPHARSRVERRTSALSVAGCVLVVLATVAALAALLWMKANHVL